MTLFALSACAAATTPSGAMLMDTEEAGVAEADAGTADASCAYVPSEGLVCAGGDNGVGVTGTSVNNEGLVGTSMNGRGVYGSSMTSQGGYFSSTSGDGLLGYSMSGFSGHFTGGNGVMIDPPGPAASAALTVNGPARLALAAAPATVVPVCGALDQTSGLFTLTKCDDRIDKLEAEVAALQARLGPADAGAP